MPGTGLALKNKMLHRQDAVPREFVVISECVCARVCTHTHTHAVNTVQRGDLTPLLPRPWGCPEEEVSVPWTSQHMQPFSSDLR